MSDSFGYRNAMQSAAATLMSQQRLTDADLARKTVVSAETLTRAIEDETSFSLTKHGWYWYVNVMYLLVSQGRSIPHEQA
jgi:hypothetical protein